jgi:hypothetical protein
VNGINPLNVPADGILCWTSDMGANQKGNA